MLELPEVLTTASQLKDSTAGRTVSEVLPPTKVHRFCWYNGEPAAYNTVLKGKKIISSEGFGIFVEIIFEEGYSCLLYTSALSSIAWFKAAIVFSGAKTAPARWAMIWVSERPG